MSSKLWGLNNICPLCEAAEPLSAYPSNVLKTRTMTQPVLSPFLGHYYSQSCDGSFEEQEEHSGCCFLTVACPCSSLQHFCTCRGSILVLIFLIVWPSSSCLKILSFISCGRKRLVHSCMRKNQR